MLDLSSLIPRPLPAFQCYTQKHWKHNWERPVYKDKTSSVIQGTQGHCSGFQKQPPPPPLTSNSFICLDNNHCHQSVLWSDGWLLCIISPRWGAEEWWLSIEWLPAHWESNYTHRHSRASCKRVWPRTWCMCETRNRVIDIRTYIYACAAIIGDKLGWEETDSFLSKWGYLELQWKWYDGGTSGCMYMCM